ncbi:hypothetical protein NDU88_000890, partial [Pleurodeles waltl]
SYRERTTGVHTDVYTTDYISGQSTHLPSIVNCWIRGDFMPVSLRTFKAADV